MKKIIVLIVLIFAAYNLTPYEYKIQIADKLGIDSSFIKNDEIKIEKGETVSLSFNNEGKTSFAGNIDNGKTVNSVNLSYGIGTKCFGNPESLKGETVFHKVVLRANKTAIINYKKINKEDNLNIYFYKVKSGVTITPPELTQVYSCKNSSLTTDFQTVEMKGNSIPSYIVVAVVGANGAKSGEYEFNIEEK